MVRPCWSVAGTLFGTAVRCLAAWTFAVTVGSGAWAATVTPNRPLDDVYLASEALPSRGAAAPAAVRSAPSVRTAANQPWRNDLRGLQAIANDPDIRVKIDAAWAASNPKSADRAEHGFWICRDRDTGQLYTRPFAAADSPRHMIPGTPSADAIGFFHTHPFPAAPQGPSAEDKQFADLSNMFGIIRSRDGLHYFGPSLKPWQPRG
jgi:hypothetical protein